MSTDFSTQEESSKFFKNFFSQNGNCHCFDCGASAGEWISVNNGITLCDNCAETHRTFGSHISHIKSAKGSDWLPSELFLLQHGGNDRLKEFFSNYTFEHGTAPVFKYKTLASFYYRRRMRFISEGKEVPELPHKDRHLEQHENEGFFDTILGGLAKFGDKVGSLFEPAEKPGHIHHHEGDHPHHAPVREDFSTLVHKGVESIKDGVSNLIGVVATLGSSEHQGENLKKEEHELKEIKSTECDNCEGMPHNGGILEKAEYLASKGYTALKGGLHTAGAFITGHSGEGEKTCDQTCDKTTEQQNLLHPETDAKIAAAQKDIQNSMSIEKVESNSKGVPEISHIIKHAEVHEKSEEIQEQEKQVAEKKAQEEEELQEIANWANEAVKAQTMPKSTKSKADQIRDQAAMIEAARGQTRISKGKGVSKQTVLHGKVDFDYIEKLQESGEAKKSEIEEPSLTEKQVTLSTLAHEAKAETKSIDTSKAFKKENDETFPKGKASAGMEKHIVGAEERKESERLNEKLAH